MRPTFGLLQILCARLRMTDSIMVTQHDPQMQSGQLHHNDLHDA